MTTQLTFTWPAGVALGAGDFFVADANRVAFAMVTNPQGWPERKLVLTGPKGCGKSHLARVFAAQTGAQIVSATAVRGLKSTLPDTPVVIEDMQLLARADEEAVFHLHNYLANEGLPLLMTARYAPARWDIKLPDLRSRMEAATLSGIADPDDGLLAALIMKLFADRQIMPPPALATYLARRIERSYAAASAIVSQMDAVALTEKCAVNQTLAARLLDKPGQSG